MISTYILMILKRNHLIFTGLIVLVLAVYLGSLSNNFVSDDIGLIKEGHNLSDVGYILAEPSLLLRRVVYGFLYQIGGLNPTIFRLSTLLFHAGNSFVIYLIVKKLSSPRTALLSALIFAAHPIFSEVVVWVSAGNYAQSSFFFLLAFYFYLQPQNKRNLTWAVLFYLLALFSFGRTFVLAPLFPLYDFLFMPQKNSSRTWWRWGPFILLGILFGLLMFTSLGSRIQTIASFGLVDEGTYSPGNHLPFAVFTYLKLLIWPQELSFYHSNLQPTSLELVLRWSSLLVFISGWVISYFRSKTIFFWLSFFVFSTALYLLPLPISLVAAERYAYLGSIGLIVSFSILCQKIVSRKKLTKLGYVFLLALLIGLSYRTIIRNQDWQNEETLTLATLKTDASNPTLQNLTGVIYQERGETDLAISHFHKAIILDPNLLKPYFNLGLTYEEKGSDTEALFFYIKSTQIDQNFVLGYQRSALIYLKKNEFAKSLENTQKALQLDPKNGDLYLLQGRSLLGLKKTEDAVTSFWKALEMNPNLKEAEMELKKLGLNAY